MSSLNDRAQPGGLVPVFAALGDPTRVALLLRIGAERRLSVTSLAQGTDMSRQAVSKHLKVLADAGLVSSVKSGRETQFVLRPGPLSVAQGFLSAVGATAYADREEVIAKATKPKPYAAPRKAKTPAETMPAVAAPPAASPLERSRAAMLEKILRKRADLA